MSFLQRQTGITSHQLYNKRAGEGEKEGFKSLVDRKKKERKKPALVIEYLTWLCLCWIDLTNGLIKLKSFFSDCSGSLGCVWIAVFIPVCHISCPGRSSFELECPDEILLRFWKMWTSLAPLGLCYLSIKLLSASEQWGGFMFALKSFINLTSDFYSTLAKKSTFSGPKWWKFIHWNDPQLTKILTIQSWTGWPGSHYKILIWFSRHKPFFELADKLCILKESWT